MNGLTVIVHHLPAPQGSKTRNPAGAIYEDNPHVASYRAAVTAATLTARHDTGSDTLDGALCLSVTFTLPRPASHYRTAAGKSDQLLPSAPTAPAVRPDLDKLLRATLDGLADAGAVRDDSRLVDVHVVKAYPGGHLDALDTPGAVIHLAPIKEA